MSAEFEVALLRTEYANAIKSLAVISEATAKASQERDAALATVARVRALHFMEAAVTARPWCASDKMLWPCPTTRALEEPK